MCVIAIKPIGINPPSNELMEKMWTTNPDGAGYMYAFNGDVYIEKGFMTYKELKDAIENLSENMKSQHQVYLKDLPFIYHFRITTHGGTSRANTHPFPISTNEEHLKALDVKAKLAMAHNGVITSMEKEEKLSDTMIFVRDVLAPLNVADRTFIDKYAALIKYVIGYSKLAFLSGDGTIKTFGDFKEPIEKDGLLYSNLNHAYTYKKTTYLGSSMYDEDDTTYTKVYKHSSVYINKIPEGFKIGGKYKYKTATASGSDFYVLENVDYLNTGATGDEYLRGWFKREGSNSAYAKIAIYFSMLEPYVENELIVLESAPLFKKGDTVTVENQGDVRFRFLKYTTVSNKVCEVIAIDKKHGVSKRYFMSDLLSKVDDSDAKRDQIGGANNEETKNIMQNANRKLYTAYSHLFIRLLPVEKGTLLTNHALSEDCVMSDVDASCYIVKVESDNFYFWATQNLYVYRQKDGTFITLDPQEIAGELDVTDYTYTYNGKTYNYDESMLYCTGYVPKEKIGIYKRDDADFMKNSVLFEKVIVYDKFIEESKCS